MKFPGSFPAIVFFFIWLAGKAQITGLRNYNLEDGLKSTSCYHVRQDYKGLMWIGTDNGFFRFDGTEFTQFNEQNGLSNPEILSCVPLRSGEIFIMPFQNGFACFKNNRFYTAKNNRELSKLKVGEDIIVHSYDEKNDELFIGRQFNPETLYSYKNGKVSVIPLHFGAALKPTAGSQITYDYLTGNLYLAKNRRLYAYNIYTQKTTACNLRFATKENYIFAGNQVVITAKDSVITIYKLVSPHVFKQAATTIIEKKADLAFMDRDHKLWVSLQSGGILYFNSDITASPVPARPMKLLNGYQINYLYKDVDGNIWFSTKNNGLFFVSQKAFQNYVHFPVENNSAYITAMSANASSLLLGYSTARGSIYRNQAFTELTLDDALGFECRAVLANNKIAVFGQSKYAFTVNLASGKATLLKGHWHIKSMTPYDSASMLICATEGLFKFNYATGLPACLLPKRTYCSLPVDSENILVGSFKHLYKFNPKTKQLRLFLKDYYFTDLKCVSKNLFAGATNLHGVVFFNNRGVLHNIGINQGLLSNQVKKLEVQDTNTYWASTNAGLAYIRRGNKELEVKNFTKIDGLPSDRVTGCVIKRDTIYIGTSKGLGIFRISELLSQEKFINKKAIISSVTVGGTEHFDLSEKISASFPHNTISFQLSFMDYASQGKISYKYKTEGLNDAWQISNSSKIILNSVPPGSYTFKVYGLGYNGKQSSNYTAFDFEIKPLFWQTWWFLALVIGLLAVLLLIIVTRIVQRSRNKKMKSVLYEKKIAELELQAIKAQINPHFIYNCLNSIQYLVYQKDYAKTENYLGVFSRMIRKTLYYSEKTFMPIQEEIDYLALYLDMEKLRFKTIFNYFIHVSGKINRSWKIPTLLVQPFVENAIKHGMSRLEGREGLIEIIFHYEEPTLSITIRDNGPGIGEKSLLQQVLNSFGLRLSQKRIEAFRQFFNTNIRLEVYDLSKKGKQGTEINLYLDLSHELKN